MSIRPSTTRLGAVVIVPILLLAACGGSTASTGPGDSTEPMPSDMPMPSGMEMPSDGSLPSFEIPSFAIPSFELGSLITNLENVDSYKVTISGSGETSYTGTVVTKPVVMRDLYVGTGDDATHIVTIGEESWMGTGDGPMQSAPNAIVAGLIPLFDPAVLLAAFANQALLGYADNLGEEDKNGQSTTHYKVEVSKLPNFAALGMPDTATIEMWVADDGYLVSFIASDFGAAGNDLTIDITDVNDPGNVVERPS